jgi:hypothetical protein
MHAQVLRQSAARRALLDVDVFSAKPHPLACSIFFPVNSSDGALPAGMGLVRSRERPYHSAAIANTHAQDGHPRAAMQPGLCLTALVSDIDTTACQRIARGWPVPPSPSRLRPQPSPALRPAPRVRQHACAGSCHACEPHGGPTMQLTRFEVGATGRRRSAVRGSAAG